MAGCETCTLSIAYDAAEELVRADNTMEEAARQRALGGIVLNRRCLEAVYEKVDCDGPTSNQNGQRVCPLQETTYNARSTAYGVWNQANYTTRLDRMAHDATEEGASAPKDEDGIGHYM